MLLSMVTGDGWISKWSFANGGTEKSSGYLQCWKEQPHVYSICWHLLYYWAIGIVHFTILSHRHSEPVARQQLSTTVHKWHKVPWELASAVARVRYIRWPLNSPFCTSFRGLHSSKTVIRTGAHDMSWLATVWSVFNVKIAGCATKEEKKKGNYTWLPCSAAIMNQEWASLSGNAVTQTQTNSWGT